MIFQIQIICFSVNRSDDAISWDCFEEHNNKPWYTKKWFIRISFQVHGEIISVVPHVCQGRLICLFTNQFLMKMLPWHYFSLVKMIKWVVEKTFENELFKGENKNRKIPFSIVLRNTKCLQFEVRVGKTPAWMQRSQNGR